METRKKKEKSTDIKNSLAVLGGDPVHEREWPPWPRAGMAAQRAILDVLHSQRWSISARTQRKQCYERDFGEDFAKFSGREFGVPCSSGTAALTIALQALDIGPGDEVIVPGMTWVACASSIINVGATPILVDIDPSSLCMSPENVESAIGPNTKAVLAVHMYASRVDIFRIREICQLHGIFLIEDGSQAHGASLKHQQIGSFGEISVFSFQQTKLLSSGEGGIALTDNEEIYRRLQKLRSDGRTYGDQKAEDVFFDLSDIGGLLGRNLCLTEFQAAILLEGMHRLPRENVHRRAMVSRLSGRLEKFGGIHIVQDTLGSLDGTTFYKVPLRFDDSEFIDIGPEKLSWALAAELNFPVEPLDRPLNDNPLYQPQTSPLVARNTKHSHLFDPKRFHLPHAETAYERCVALPHPCLLGGEPEIDAIIAALIKIKRHAKTLKALALKEGAV